MKASMSLHNQLPGIVLKCQCTSKDHMVIIEHDVKFDEYNIHMQMDHWQPWYKRIVPAWRYLLGKRWTKCHFAEVPVHGEHFRNSVKNLIQGFANG